MAMRVATAADGPALQRMMRESPRFGEGQIWSIVNAPDFFGRARAYEEATVLVAERDGALAGSAAYAIRETVVDGRPARVAYEFQYFVSPAFREQGVGRSLRQRIEAELVARGVDLTTALVSPGNAPSLRLFAAEGFRPRGEPALVVLSTTRHIDPRAPEGFRQATTADLPAIARLVNATWSGRDFFAPVTPAALVDYLERTPELSLDRVVIREERGEAVACAGIWNWSRIQQVEVRAAEPGPDGRLRPVGAPEVMKQWGLAVVGFRAPNDLAMLLTYLNNRAAAKGIGQVGLVAEPGHPLLEAVRDLAHGVVPIRLLAKPPRAGVAAGAGPAFVDVVDL